MKLRVNEDSTEFDERMYDRDNGDGAAQMVIDGLRATGDVNYEAVQAIHRNGIADAVEIVKGLIGKDTTTTTEGGIPTVSLGMSDVAEPITDKLNRLGL
jgi:hypothetical protein